MTQILEVTDVELKGITDIEDTMFDEELFDLIFAVKEEDLEEESQDELSEGGLVDRET